MFLAGAVMWQGMHIVVDTDAMHNILVINYAN